MILINKLLSSLFLFKQKISRALQMCYIRQNLSNDSFQPIIKGKIHWNATNVKFGKNVTLFPGVYLWGNNIEIGDNVSIGYNTLIYSKKKIKIGNNSSIAGHCFIIDSNHSTASGKLIREQSLDVADNGIHIGEDVWIASQCTIIKGACIRDHAIIGANSMVNKEISENAIAFGTPAKIVSYRK